MDNDNSIVAKTHIVDFVFAILSLIFGYLFVKNSLFSSLGIGITAFIFIFVISSLIYAKLKRGKLGYEALLGALLITSFSLVFTLSDNGFIKFLTIIFEFIATVYWYFRMFKCRNDILIDEMFGFDILSATFEKPFSSFGKNYSVIWNGSRDKKGFKIVGYILIGFIIAIIPTAIVLPLLLNADGAFNNLVKYLFSDIIKMIRLNIFPVIFGIPVSMYIFGLMYSCSGHNSSNAFDRETSKSLTSAFHVIPTIIACSALTPLLLIYLLFFISQAGYFLSAFESIIPKDMTYAQYARNGFFELCAVSAINAVAILLILALVKRKENNELNSVTRVYISIFSLFTTALIIIALSKMFLYIKNYGLTLYRVYSTWFLILLLVLFLLLILKQIFKKMNYMIVAVVSFIILFGGLVFSDIDGRIAQYNINHYLSGDLKELDVEMMGEDLSSSAVPYLINSYDKLDLEDKANIDKVLKEYKELIKNRGKRGESYRSYNIPASEAADLLFADDNKFKIFGWAW